MTKIQTNTFFRGILRANEKHADIIYCYFSNLDLLTKLFTQKVPLRYIARGHKATKEHDVATPAEHFQFPRLKN